MSTQRVIDAFALDHQRRVVVDVRSDILRVRCEPISSARSIGVNGRWFEAGGRIGDTVNRLDEFRFLGVKRARARGGGERSEDRDKLATFIFMTASIRWVSEFLPPVSFNIAAISGWI